MNVNAIIDITSDAESQERLRAWGERLQREETEADERLVRAHEIELLAILNDTHVVSRDGVAKLLKAKLGEEYDASCLETAFMLVLYVLQITPLEESEQIE